MNIPLKELELVLDALVGFDRPDFSKVEEYKLSKNINQICTDSLPVRAGRSLHFEIALPATANTVDSRNTYGDFHFTSVEWRRQQWLSSPYC
jgi:hypothetical protein